MVGKTWLCDFSRTKMQNLPDEIIRAQDFTWKRKGRTGSQKLEYTVRGRWYNDNGRSVTACPGGL